MLNATCHKCHKCHKKLFPPNACTSQSNVVPLYVEPLSRQTFPLHHRGGAESVLQNTHKILLHMQPPLRIPRQLVWPDHTQEDFRRQLPHEAYETLLEMWDSVDDDCRLRQTRDAFTPCQLTLAEALNEARYNATLLAIWHNPGQHSPRSLLSKLIRADFQSDRLKLLGGEVLLLNMTAFLARASMKGHPTLDARSNIIGQALSDWEEEDEHEESCYLSRTLAPLRQKAESIAIAPCLPCPQLPTLPITDAGVDLLYYVRSIGDQRELDRLLRLFTTIQEQQALLDWLQQAETLIPDPDPDALPF